MNSNTYDPYHALAEEIVDQSMDDYLEYSFILIKLNKRKSKLLAKVQKESESNMSDYYRPKLNKLNEKIKKVEDEIDDIVDFFYSDWYHFLTDRDPDIIMDKLEQEVKRMNDK